jgi:hypothetical protein
MEQQAVRATRSEWQWLAEKVSVEKHNECLWKLFGRHWLKVECVISARLEALSPESAFNTWEFFRLPNGAFYMAPAATTPVHIWCDDNRFDATVSADAAGIIACLMGFNQLSSSSDADPQIERAFHLLRAYIYLHPEARAIFRAID